MLNPIQHGLAVNSEEECRSQSDAWPPPRSLLQIVRAERWMGGPPAMNDKKKRQGKSTPRWGFSKNGGRPSVRSNWKPTGSASSGDVCYPQRLGSPSRVALRSYNSRRDIPCTARPNAWVPGDSRWIGSTPPSCSSSCLDSGTGPQLQRAPPSRPRASYATATYSAVTPPHWARNRQQKWF